MRRALITALIFAPLALTSACNKAPHDSASPLGTRFGGADESAKRSEARGGDRGPRREAGEARPAPRDFDGGGMGTSWDERADFESEAIAEEHRPGLGTAYGENRRSSVESVGFRRADPSTPDVVFTIHYDDAAGVRAAASRRRSRAWSDEAMQEHGGLSFALLDDGDRVLPAASVGSQLFAVGQPDARYNLAVANDTGTAYELVASVDGLDIIDGRRASFEKRGYIIDPFSSVVIEGWRTSEDTVAAFRFSSIEDSYAERMGDGRNVGVIGAAFFREAPRHWEDWRSPEDGWRRDTADPFPGN